MPGNFNRIPFPTMSTIPSHESLRIWNPPLKTAESISPSLCFTYPPEIPLGEVCQQPFTFEFTETKLPPPDVSNGLGGRQAKRDLVNLSRYVKQELTLMVQDNTLCTFESPCWKRLSEEQGKAKVLRVLTVNGLDDCLVDSDCRAIYRRLLIDPELRKEVVPLPSPWKLNLRDGTFDLQTRVFSLHAPEDYFFRYLNISMADIERGVQGPIFESFVENLSNGNPEVRRQLLELTALTVLHYPIKKFFVLLGPSNTGKTQFGRFLEELVGHENVASIQGVDDFKNRFTTSSFVNKLLVTCLDLPDGILPERAVGTIKQLVGDDSLKGEAKHRDPITFYDKPLLLCAGNHPIRISHMAQELALLNRMVVIPFLNPVSEEAAQQQLYLSLLDEAPYIIREALIAFQDLAKRNFQVTQVEIPERYQPRDGRTNYQAIATFVRECCTFDSKSTVSTQDLYRRFISWGDFRPTKIDFSRCLGELFAQVADITPIKRTTDGQRGYKGLRLCDTNDQTSFPGREVVADEVHQL